MWKLTVVREKTEPYCPKGKVACADDIETLFMGYFAKKDREEFCVVALDNKGKVAGFSVVAVGALDACAVTVREVFKVLLLSNAKSWIAMHNHPAGDPTPSPDDVAFTKKLAEASKIMGIPLLDHVIFGDELAKSLLEMQLMR